eukprot:TRINITY_DN107193_c0_g1_i1.p1 TRINITY_DN107193_c0_g1~~TRINITY_DN107193_c0_g1_i1.p1  ORF type:complete len:550 (-),score=135.43 TRINITY_DN107193_c0_g1_i1:168-1772(-)
MEPGMKQLQSELANLRYRLARDKGMSAHADTTLMKMSLDNIFTDKLLRAISEAWPQSLEELGQVPGFSEVKLQKLGAQVLAVCQHCRESLKRAAGDELGSPDAKRQALSKDQLQEADLTEEQRQWAKVALGGQSLFLTGEAGTGKSFLLGYIIQELKKLQMVAVTASTGIAAASLGGCTVHSFSGAGRASGDHEEIVQRVVNNIRSRARWQETQVLVIDEISMLDGDFFELLEKIARRTRASEKPFGGMQLLLCGDFLQLPPVMASCFAFETEAWKKAGLQTAELLTPMRQQDDKEFFKLLSEVRIGICSPSTSQLLAKCSSSVKKMPTDIVPTRLYCVNKDVDAENATRLAELPGEVEDVYAIDTWKSVAERDRAKLSEIMDKSTPVVLRLKLDAQVIITKNVASQGLVNGMRGKIESWSTNGSSNGIKCPYVRFDNGQVLKVEPTSFQVTDGTGELRRLQLPMKLGWAMTVHKSQGCTISRAELQLENAFDSGQVYVALSRVKSLDGLWLKGKPVTQNEVKAHPSVLEFYFA